VQDNGAEEAIKLAISPMDIHNKEFSTVRVGGYNKEEVDAFLDLVAEELDRIIRRYQEQSLMIEDLKQRLAKFEEMQQTLQNAIINAQRSADQIVEEARAQAQAIIQQAQEQKARLSADAQAERERILAAYSGLREQVLSYLFTVRELLEKNRALLSDYEARLVSREPREAATTFPTPPPEEFMGERAIPEKPATPVISSQPRDLSGETEPSKEEGTGEGAWVPRASSPAVEEPADMDLEAEFLSPPEREAPGEGASGRETPDKEGREEKHFFWE
jgi:cell division initiation protein